MVARFSQSLLARERLAIVPNFLFLFQTQNLVRLWVNQGTKLASHQVLNRHYLRAASWAFAPPWVCSCSRVAYWLRTWFHDHSWLATSVFTRSVLRLDTGGAGRHVNKPIWNVFLMNWLLWMTLELKLGCGKFAWTRIVSRLGGL